MKHVAADMSFFFFIIISPSGNASGLGMLLKWHLDPVNQNTHQKLIQIES